MTDVITVGCQTSTGGVVTNGSSGITVNGMPVALVGDMATCCCAIPTCTKLGPIVALVPRAAEVNGKMLAKAGDLVNTGCGTCTLLPSKHQITLSPLMMDKVSFGSLVALGNGVNINQVPSVISTMNSENASQSKPPTVSVDSASVNNQTSSTPIPSIAQLSISPNHHPPASTPSHVLPERPPLTDVLLRPVNANDSIFKAIEHYVVESARLKSITSPKNEDVRMYYAKKTLENPHATRLQKKRALERLREGDRNGAPRIVTGEIVVTRGDEVINPRLLRTYNEYLQQIELGPNVQPLKKIKPTTWLLTDSLNEQKGEVYLLHGTNDDILQLITHNGFRPDLSTNHGTIEDPRYGALGQGSYFTDSMAKVMTYTRNPLFDDYDPDPEYEYKVLLAKVILGMPKKKHSFLQLGWESLRKQGVDEIKEGRHSIYSQGLLSGKKYLHKIAGGTNEFLIKNAAAAYPQYIIYWKHKTR